MNNSKKRKENLGRLKILNEKEKEKIQHKLNDQFGIQEIPGKIIMIGKERLFVFLGDLELKKILEFDKIGLIDKIGIYFAKFVEDSIRLSIEGTLLLKDQITKNIFEIDEDQMNQWMKGQDLQIKTGKKDFLIIKYKEDFLGCGKASKEKIGNFIPKNRRLKERIVS